MLLGAFNPLHSKKAENYDMPGNPLFSIVITTTRPRLLKYALASALSQDFDDFEVIVSDNSDAGCEEIVASFDSPRVRYFRPGDYMTIIDHWNFAFSHARGKWQTLLCDDHVMIPSGLRLLSEGIHHARSIGAVFWTVASYYDHTWFIPDERETLRIPEFTGDIVKLDPKAVLNAIFNSGIGLASHVKPKVPIIVRAVYSRDVIDKIRERLGDKLFFPICPMTAAAVSVLAYTDRIVKIDKPLTIIGTPVDSASGHINDPATYERMYSGTIFEHAPIKAMTVFPSTSAETLMRMQQLLPEKLGGLQLSWRNYFLHCRQAIEELKRQGADNSVELEMYAEALAEMPPDIRRRIEKRAASKQMEILTELVGKLGYKLNQVRRILKPKGYQGSVLQVRNHGLASILESAQYIDNLVISNS